MQALVLAALMSAQVPCPPDAAALTREASVRAGEFDLAGAAAILEGSPSPACATVTVAALYARGLAEARDAFLQGGSPESLEPVRRAIAALDRMAQNRPGPAEIARLTLSAASAAAQSERDEMRLYLDAALRMEALQRAAGQPGVPVISVATVAGELWLQVHRYEEARQVFLDAAAQEGWTPRLLSGAARAAARLGEVFSACEAFARLLDAWKARPSQPAEVDEGRAYLARRECRPSGSPQ